MSDSAALPHGFPVVLDLRGVAVLVVGGGRVAARKADALLAAGAHVTAVAPDFADEFPEVAVRHRRPYEPHDVVGHRLVFTATSDGAVNRRVAADATAAQLWVNSADDVANCSFFLPAVVRRGPVVAAVSSGGTSPALAGHLRDRIGAVIGDEVADAALQLHARRRRLQQAGIATDSVDWSTPIAELLASPGTDRSAGSTSAAGVEQNYD